MTSGIYKITNKVNNNSYIGLSKNIEKRWSDHKGHMNGSRQDCIDKVLYKAMRKYGVDNFEMEILEECEENKLIEREIYWINYYDTFKNRRHYNSTPGGDLAGPNSIKQGEDHGMAKLTEKEVVFCRKCYKEGKRSRDIYTKYFADKVKYSGFLRMWHGKTWKHIQPEVFNENPHKAKYTETDCEIITALFKESGLSLSKFVKTEECYVGYGTAWKMVNEPTFYKDKN